MYSQLSTYLCPTLYITSSQTLSSLLGSARHIVTAKVAGPHSGNRSPVWIQTAQKALFLAMT